MFPTPSANQYETKDLAAMLERRERCKAKSKNGNGFGLTLANAVRMWPTPKGSPSGPDFARMNRDGSGGDDLATAVARETFNTPRARDWKAGGKECLPEQIGGQLNPPWVEWLMGFPIGWTDLED